jgi:hypothetical protein
MKNFLKSAATLSRRIGRVKLVLSGLATIGLGIVLSQGCAKTTNPAPSGEAFASPEQAVDMAISALRANDEAKLLAIVGPDGQDIVSSGDEVVDHTRRQKFLAQYDEKHTLTDAGPGRKVLVIGDKEWPFPIPIVQQGDVWKFDVAAGREEILNRRIGENELSAIEVCKAIADAEQEYALRDPQKSGMHEYARKFASDPGQKNGLYWPVKEGEEPSPLGEFVAAAAAEGYKRKESGPTPYHGYYYEILEAQGPAAPDGEVDYVVNDRMTLGYAVLAYPADYGKTGIMTFIMGPDGAVYQQNLGADTAKEAKEINWFNPDEGWTKVPAQDQTLATAPTTEPAK